MKGSHAVACVCLSVALAKYLIKNETGFIKALVNKSVVVHIQQIINWNIPNRRSTLVNTEMAITPSLLKILS